MPWDFQKSNGSLLLPEDFVTTPMWEKSLTLFSEFSPEGKTIKGKGMQ